MPPSDGVTPAAFLRAATQMAWVAFRERRLSPSPRRWLVDLRHLYGVMVAEGRWRRAAAPPVSRAAAAGARRALEDACARALGDFLASGERLRFPGADAPAVSVIVVLWNRAELTLRCLRSLAEERAGPLELILVDNASTDATPTLLDRLEGVRVLRHPRNAGFAPAVNAAARLARGRHLVLLNNDAALRPGALAAAVSTLEGAADVGAVGGKLILPDGSLQEAGSLVWRDGSCLGYGRGDSPDAPPYAFRRDVDFCSGAFLATRRAVFAELGGLEEAFAPAYYEDADYCVRLWKRGHRVVYEPRAVAEHVEFASSGGMADALRLQEEHRQRFVATHADWLAGQRVPGPGPDRATVLLARTRPGPGLRVLVFDDRVPHADAGSGFPRAVELVRALVDLGHAVTLYPLADLDEDWTRIYADIPRSVEVMAGYGAMRVGSFLRDRHGFYDRVVVSRPQNMRLLRARVATIGRWPAGLRVVYDAEAISALREAAARRLAGQRVSEAEVERRVADELRLTEGVEAVLAVSETEGARFAAAGGARVVVLRHAVAPAPTARPFAAREGILFVGAFTPVSPNADSVVWFAREVLPRIRARLGDGVGLTVAGPDPSAVVVALAGPAVRVLGGVADLTPLYDRARVFAAPTRFAAGVPLKVYHAAAHGLPVVCTSLLAGQLGWTSGVEILAADEPAAFAERCCALYTDEPLWRRQRAAALDRVARDCSPRGFRDTLQAALGVRL